MLTWPCWLKLAHYQRLCPAFCSFAAPMEGLGCCKWGKGRTAARSLSRSRDRRYSSVGIIKNGRVPFIPNDQGDRTTPLLLLPARNVSLVRQPSFRRRRLSMKRVIDRRFQDSTVQKDMKLSPREVAEKHSLPMSQVKVKGENKVHSVLISISMTVLCLMFLPFTGSASRGI